MPVAEGRATLEELHRQLDCLRNEAAELRQRLEPVLAPMQPTAQPLGSPGGTGTNSEVADSIRDATQKVSQVRGELMQILERFQF